MFKQFALTLFISFLLFPVCTFADDTDSTEVANTISDKITLQDSIIASGKFVEKLDSGSFYNLPIGILGGNNKDPNYAILIDEVAMYPQKATFRASMVITNPFDSAKLVFTTNDIAFTFSGGIQGTYRLELIGKGAITVCKDIGLKILPGSYVECDCRGFKSLHLKGSLELSDKKFVLADLKGKAKAGKVTAFFETSIQDWNDLTFSISLDPFQLKEYPDFTFQCKNLAVDMSDYKNPDVLKFPVGYESPYTASTIQLWRGVYIQSASLILGDKFKKKDSDDPISFSVENLLIDEQGFSGKVAVNNLLSLEKGSMGGWKFSISQLSLQFVTNQLTGGSISGLVHVPICKDSTNFSYAATVDVAGNYTFTVSPATTLSMNLFGAATLDLYKTSYIKINIDSSGFVPVVNLTGKLTINANIDGDDESSENGGEDESEASASSKSKLSLPHLDFEGFRISTREPLIDIQYMAYTGSDQGKLSKFPLTISKITFTNQKDIAKLSITAKINLKESDGEGFSGETTLTLTATRNGYKYKFKGVQIDKIAISVEQPGAFKLNGSVAFSRGDATYGNGFRGTIDATFSDNISISAVAVFGNVDSMRYFFVDAFVAISPGIQAGPISFLGFGGGLYHHMKQQAGVVDINSFGASSSGIVYKPDKKMSTGIRATVLMGIIKEQLINAKATFEIAFTSSGGVSSISFEGIANCISNAPSIDEKDFKKTTQDMMNSSTGLSAGQTGPISARLYMNKDFQTGAFHAEMNVMVNVANSIKGIGKDNIAGWAVLHVADGEWYLHIGTPTDPIGVQFFGMAKATAYFMAGHHLPASFPINPKVAQILNISAEELAGKRGESSIAAGRGVAFGATYSISTGDQSFLVFYGSFDLGLGFDIMLADYGNTAYCEGSTPPLGINGWYAKGQAYAYFSGKIGIEAKVFRKRKKFEILSIATAAYLKAEAPNPIWMVGYVGGSYRILGGMIKGNCNFKVEVGQQCTIKGAQSALADLQLIGDVSPAENTSDVDVFTTPQVVFNVPVNSEQKISESDDSTTYFRINLSRLTLKNATDSFSYAANWNANKDVMQLVPDAVLSPKTKYTLEVKINFEEKVNGVWQPYTVDGEQLSETRTVPFTTGELPDRIPASEIAYTYPVDRQYNFMPKEYNQAYLIFHRDLKVFFEASADYNKQARWTQGTTTALTDINYNSSEKTLYMGIPGKLSLNRISYMELVAIPTATSSAADRNVSKSSSTTGSDSASVVVTTQAATGTITTTEEKVMFDLHFKTSKYATFADRFNVSEMTTRALYDRGYMEFYLVASMPGTEGFDDFEKYGIGNNKPLIALTAELNNTAWFTSDVNPKTYQQYPWFGYHAITWRDTSTFGLRAERAITNWQSSGYSRLTDGEIQADMTMNNVSFVDMAYMPAYYWNEDYMDIRDGLAYYTRNSDVSGNATIVNILGNIKLRPIKPGAYPIRFSYVLPGKNLVTSSKVINLKSTIKTDATDI
jgi:hypothetical protein